MTIKKFKYSGCKITIQDYETSWDKKIIIQKGKKRDEDIFNTKHFSDAKDIAKKMCKKLK